MDVTPQKDKSNKPVRSFLKAYSTLRWNFNLFRRAYINCGKSRAKKFGKFLRAPDVLGRKLENLRPSTNKLKETPCVFFVTMLLKKLSN